MMRPADEAWLRQMLEDRYLCKKMKVMHRVTNEGYQRAYTLWQHEQKHYQQISDELREKFK